MKRFNYILITLMFLFGSQSNVLAQLSKLEREYQIYHKGKQYEIEILLEDKNEDNNYDFITVEINGNDIVESKLTFLNAESSSKPFPRDTRISDIEEQKCETTDEKMLSFGVYDFNSIQVAQFHYDCEKEEAFYDFNPDKSDNGKSEDNELSFKSDDLSFLGVGLSPNPAKTHIYIVYDPDVVRDDITIRIADDSGTKVFEKKYDQRKIKNNRIKIDVNSFKKGLYEVELETLELSLILNFLKR